MLFSINHKTPMKDLDLSSCLFVLGVFTCFILFSGTPDLMDAILFHLTQGKIPLPPTP